MSITITPEELVTIRCVFCKRDVQINPWKKRKKCKCGAAWFSRRAGKSDYVEEGWRKNGKEWVYI